MKSRGRQRILLTASVLSVMACFSCNGPSGQDIRYSHFEKIPDNGWKSTKALIFEPRPIDSIVRPGDAYRLEMMVRLRGNRPAADIPIVVNTDDETGLKSSDTLRINVDIGQMKARHSYGTTELSMTLDDNLRLNDGYRVEIHPLADREDSRDLIDIGLILIRKNK